MKVLILSDSHGWRDELFDVFDRHHKDVDQIIHCGDSELPDDTEGLYETLVVKGNCDSGNVSFPNEIIQDMNGITFYITHGHLYNVKMSLVPLSYRGEEVGAKIVCFGHSHIATTVKENGVIYINPGSIRLPRGRSEQTYCICEAHEGRVTVSFFERSSGEEIAEMRKVYEL